MKNKTNQLLALLLCLVLGMGVEAYGQSSQTAHLSLSSYTISPAHKGNFIAYVWYGKEACKEGLSIVSDTAQVFCLASDGALLLREGVDWSARDSFTYGVSLSYKGVEEQFDLVRDDFHTNGVVAHRGAWKNTQTDQNGIESFLEAVKLGCEGSEFDVWLSEDKEVVLSHDPIIGGHEVEHTSAQELQKTQLPQGSYIPTLRAFLTKAKEQNQTRLFLEIKYSQVDMARTLELTDQVVAIVRELKAQAWVEYISFSYEALLRIHELDPTAKTAYLGSDKDIRELKKDGLTGLDYSFYAFDKDPLLPAKAQQLGLEVNVWTVNTEEQLKQFLASGVDYITTDEPERLLQLLGSQHRR